MSSEKVKIKDLPSKNSILGTDIFIESDTTNTYKVTAENISAFVVESDTLKNAYVDKSTVGINGGITPLNDNGKVNGTYIQYGTTSNTAYEGSAGKILETNLDNHLTDNDAHGYNTKIEQLSQELSIINHEKYSTSSVPPTDQKDGDYWTKLL